MILAVLDRRARGAAGQVRRLPLHRRGRAPDRAGLRPRGRPGRGQRDQGPAARARAASPSASSASPASSGRSPASPAGWPRPPGWASARPSSRQGVLRARSDPRGDARRGVRRTSAARCVAALQPCTRLDLRPTEPAAAKQGSSDVDQRDDELLRATLAAVAPGTELRDGLERILRGRTGALIVLGHDKLVEQISTGGFPLDVEFSATRLRELAKMDGAHRRRPRGLADPARRHPAAARPLDRDQRVRHPAPHRRAGGQADRLPRGLGEPVDADRRPLRRRPPARARGLQRHPVARQPGPADPRALQVPPRRGHRHPVGARDRGPRHRARRRQRAAAPRDGAPDQRRDRRLRRRARRRRPPAHPAARGAHRRPRQRPRARHPRLPPRGPRRPDASRRP